MRRAHTSLLSEAFADARATMLFRHSQLAATALESLPADVRTRPRASDLCMSAGDCGFWQGSFRDRASLTTQRLGMAWYSQRALTPVAYPVVRRPSDVRQ